MANQYTPAGEYLAQYDPDGNRTDKYDYLEDTGSQWSGALGGAGSGALGGAALGTMILPGVGTAIGAGAGALFGGISGWMQGSDADKAARLAKARAAQAARQRAAIEAQMQGAIDANKIYDDKGNKLETNQFWTNLRSKESDIASKFDNQQHGLSGVLASRGMMGSGQELASRSALAGGQARTLSDFSTGQIDRQQDIVRDLEQQKRQLSQGLYGVDVNVADRAQQQAQQSQAAMWKNIGDMAQGGSKMLTGMDASKLGEAGKWFSGLGGSGEATKATAQTTSGIPTMGWDTFTGEGLSTDPSTWGALPPPASRPGVPSYPYIPVPSGASVGLWDPYMRNNPADRDYRGSF